MSGKAQPLCLLTFHGTLLCLDGGTPRHVPLRAASTRTPPLIFEHAGSAARLIGGRLVASDVNGGFTFTAGLHDATLALRANSGFASAEPGGAVSTHAVQCLGWESFLPVPVADLALLHELLSPGWRLDDAIPAADGQLGRNFSLNFGEIVVDLLRTLPFGPESGPDRLLLIPRGGAPHITARRWPATSPSPPKTPPKIWINTLGNMANRALQYLAAAGIRYQLPGAMIENIRLPEWGMDLPAPPPVPASAAWTGKDMFQIDVPGLADCLRRGAIETVVIESYTYHLDHYPPRATCRGLLGRTVGGANAAGFGLDKLVCSIRGAEILTGRHPDYFPLPPAYYRRLAAHTGLDLVFFGQLEENAYTQALRREFPAAQFINGVSPEHDLEVLRQSKNLALSISSFAWLAAWLSEAARVFVPVGGMFSPVQHPDTCFLPLDEPGFEFLLLPYAKSVNMFKKPAEFAAQQKLIGAGARFTDAEELRAIQARAATLGMGRVLAGGFDPEFYLQKYPDVAATVLKGEQSALHHYLQMGAAEGRLPLDFDAKFYLQTYPDAAMQLAEGRITDALHHYLAIGHAAGHRPKGPS